MIYKKEKNCTTHSADTFNACMFHSALLPNLLLLADVVPCSVGKGVYRCGKEIDRSIGSKSDTFPITYRIL